MFTGVWYGNHPQKLSNNNKKRSKKWESTGVEGDVGHVAVGQPVEEHDGQVDQQEEAVALLEVLHDFNQIPSAC